MSGKLTVTRAVRLDHDLDDRLNAYAARTGRHISDVVRIAIANVLAGEPDRRDTVHYPKLRVEVPHRGLTVLTNVWLDGQRIPATRVAFDSGDSDARARGLVKVTLEFIGELDAEIDTPLALTAIER